jgi:hypothetical protein
MNEHHVCDFCGDRNIRWHYPADPASVIQPTDDIHVLFTGAWAACSTCHALIEADNRDALAMRATTISHIPLSHARDAHGLFFLSRPSGPANRGRRTG